MTSREFWMFVGALLLMISSAYITFWTSLPIFNKIFGTKAAIGEDVEYVYNRVIVLVVVVIGVLTAITQYFKYKDTPKDYMRKKLLWPTIAALVIALAVSFGYGLQYDKYGFGFLGALYVALFAGIYAVIANAAYLWNVLKGNWKAGGASISHVGFGLMIVGILISASNKEVISINRTGIYIPGLKDVKGKDEDARQNATLIQGIPTDMGRYTVTYLGDSTAAGDEKTYFKVHYERKDKESGKVLEEFRLYPDAFVMKGGEGTNISANPDAKHYWDHDVFTYITSMPNPDAVNDTSTFRNHLVASGDTVFYSNGYILVKEVVVANKNDNPELPVVDSAWLSSLRVYGKNGQEFDAQPAYFKKDGIPGNQPDTVMPQSLILMINRVMGNRVELGVRESETVMRFVTLKAYAFPMINVLWLGTIIMFIGFMISALHRIRRKVS
jgi:cytochrome c-type biogenesis protein CcmF